MNITRNLSARKVFFLDKLPILGMPLSDRQILAILELPNFYLLPPFSHPAPKSTSLSPTQTHGIIISETQVCKGY